MISRITVYKLLQEIHADHLEEINIFNYYLNHGTLLKANKLSTKSYPVILWISGLLDDSFVMYLKDPLRK